MVKTTKHTIKCDLCQSEFQLAKGHLKEVQVTLNKEGLAPHEATLTFLECPICGKQYIVILDDEKTLALAAKLRSILTKQFKFRKLGKPSSILEKKYKDMKWRLDYNRQKLADNYFGSTYQLEGVLEQLDYRYRAR